MPRRSAIASLISAASVTLLLAAAPPALASTVQPNDIVYHDAYRVSSNKATTYADGDWVICGYVASARYTQHPSCTKTTTVTATIGGSITSGLSVKEISTSVGFNVSWSFAKGVGFTNGLEVKPGGSGYLYVGAHYLTHVVVTQKGSCSNHGNCSDWAYYKTGTVQHFVAPVIKYGGSGAV